MITPDGLASVVVNKVLVVVVKYDELSCSVVTCNGRAPTVVTPNGHISVTVMNKDWRW